MKIFAHRGISGYYPENTLAAIEAAVKAKVYGIEIDVFAVEDELVVIHDRHLLRTTGVNTYLEEMSFTELRQLDAGQGQKIPTLWEVLTLVNNQAVLNIELKGHNTVDLLVTLLDKAEQQLRLNLDTILVSSFHHPLLAKLKQQRPKLLIGALTANIPLDYAQFAEDLQAFSVHCDKGFIDSELVKDAKRRGLEVYVYTVNEAKEAEELKKIGVDGIFCNYPIEALGWC